MTPHDEFGGAGTASAAPPPASDETSDGELVLELIGQKVRRLRMQMALTQRDLALRSGLNASSVSYLERGIRRARISTIRQLARGLGCEPPQISRLVALDSLEPDGADRAGL